MKRTFLFLSLLLLGTAAYAQQKKSTAAKKSSGSAVRKSSGGASNSGWGIGLRGGSLTGLSVKKYMSKAAFEFNMGALYGYGYDNRFYRGRDRDDYEYIGYGRGGSLGLQARLMGQRGIKGAAGLDWYYGGGLQMRFDRSYYNYRYKSYYGPDKDDYVWVNERGRASANVGLDGLVGLEYRMREVPLSFFADTNLYIELARYTGWVNLQGGLGLRYNF